MAKRIDISAEYARQLLNYDPETGILTWKARTPDMFRNCNAVACKSWNSRYAGFRAGFSDADGYLIVQIAPSRHYVSNLAWLIHYGTYPKSLIHFRDLDRSNNILDNLRESFSEEDRKERSSSATARWLSKPGNREKRQQSVEAWRQTAAGQEAHRKHSLIYAAKNRDKERERAARWRLSDPARAVASHRLYYEKNYLKVREVAKARRVANPEVHKEYTQEYKARKRAGGGGLSRNYRSYLMSAQNGLCAACACDLEISGFHLDHITPISKGGPHRDENVQLLCPTCNLRKSAKTFDRFLAELKAPVT
jgi:5-methylcytosine-specific restriction endonuclease McrA